MSEVNNTHTVCSISHFTDSRLCYRIRYTVWRQLAQRCYSYCQVRYTPLVQQSTSMAEPRSTAIQLYSEVRFNLDNLNTWEYLYFEVCDNQTRTGPCVRFLYIQACAHTSHIISSVSVYKYRLPWPNGGWSDPTHSTEEAHHARLRYSILEELYSSPKPWFYRKLKRPPDTRWTITFLFG